MRKLKITSIKEPDRILNYWMNEKRVVLLIILFGIVFNSATVAGPVLQGKLLDSIVNREVLSMTIIRSGLFILAIVGIQTARFFKRYYVRRFANSVSASMRLTIYNNIVNDNIANLSDENTGSLMSKVIADVDLCVEGMRKVTTEIFDTGVLMAAYVAAMLYYDPYVTLFSCLFVPVAMLLAEKLKTVIYRYSRDYRDEWSSMTGMTYHNMEHVLLLRQNGAEKTYADRYGQELEVLRGKAVKANILEGSMQPIYNAIALLGVAAVIYMGGSLVIEGKWTVGVFSSYMVMFMALTTKASKGAKLFNSAQKSRISWLRIKAYLKEYRDYDITNKTPAKEGGLIVDNLSFSYGSGEPVIRNISFEAKPGDIVGVTGPVACGKSTLGLALLGMYPYGGSVRLLGKELLSYGKYERSCVISYQGHDPELLTDTIYENVALGRNVDVEAVLRDVCFSDDLEAMPLREQTIVGSGGAGLSGGQQMRIALARALAAETKLIILDDPFAAVDMKTEAAIIKNLRQHYKESIIIIISHRLAIFKDADLCIMLNKEGGGVYGTHAELLDTCEEYAAIYNLQCGEKNEK